MTTLSVGIRKETSNSVELWSWNVEIIMYRSLILVTRGAGTWKAL